MSFDALCPLQMMYLTMYIISILFFSFMEVFLKKHKKQGDCLVPLLPELSWGT